MSASTQLHHGVAQNVGHSAAPRKIGAGKLLEFTRHPRLYVRVRAIPLQACLRFVLEALLTFADRDGVCWLQARDIAAITPRSAKGKRYALPSVLRALRDLRTGGWIGWRNVKPFARYPSRAKDKTLVWGNGKRTYSGGRVWVVNLEKLAGLQGGMSLAGSITSDRSGTITSDRPSDLFPSGKVKMDPGSLGARPHAPPGHRVASETPGSPVAGPSTDPLPADAEAPPARPTGARVASETPSAAAAASPLRRVQAPAPQAPAARGEGEHGSRQRQRFAADVAPSELATPETLIDVRKALARIFRGPP